MMDLLYQIIIQPIYILLEILYKFFYEATCYEFVPTVVFISFVISALCLPFYLRADAISEEEAEIRKKLEPRVKSIKRNFKGDEKQLLLQTYYRQNNYHPIMAMRSSLSLLLQIPFFIAAYCFFTNSNLAYMNLLGFFGNAAEPDRLLKIKNYSINILPILMTLVNIAAGYVYAKGKSFKENINLYIVSLVFLVLLYNQPSGLVFYWLYNNLFSLLKNLCLILTTPEKLLKYTGLTAIIVFYLNFRHFKTGWDFLIILVIILCFLKFNPSLKLPKLNIEIDKLYLISVISFWIFTGLFIPSNIISSSPTEFLSESVHPVQILYYPFLSALGIFVFWGGILWTLSSKNTKKYLGIFACLLFLGGLINLLMVPIPKAVLLNNLTFDMSKVSFYFGNLTDKLKYIFILLTISGSIGFLVLKNKVKILQKFMLGILVTISIISLYNISRICYLVNHPSNAISEQDNTQIKKCFHLSKNNKNVIVFFMDRAVSSFFPLVLHEKPELNEMYSGFTYYPNTVSLYRATVFGYPPILGGYEYSPIDFAKTKDTFEEDYNKAISVLPLIFKKQGWDVTITDTPWIDYEISFEQQDKIYTKNGINFEPYRTKMKDYLKSMYADSKITHDYVLAKRNFIFYSLSMISPPRIRKYIYDNGKYLRRKSFSDISSEFILNYAALKILPKLTDFSSDNNNFIVINNDTVHSSAILKFPEYTLVSAAELDKQEKKQIYNLDDNSLSIYHPMAAAMLSLGEYFDYLKANGVYDNTRIIIVADHGTSVQNPEIEDNFFNKHTILYNPLLMFKDFNQSGDVTISNDFMTNADTPTLATQNIIKNPINPYTNRPITSNPKKNGVYIMQADGEWHPKLYIGRQNPLVNRKKFSFVKDNILKKENWETDIPYSKLQSRLGLID